MVQTEPGLDPVSAGIGHLEFVVVPRPPGNWSDGRVGEKDRTRKDRKDKSPKSSFADFDDAFKTRFEVFATHDFTAGERNFKAELEEAGGEALAAPKSPRVMMVKTDIKFAANTRMPLT